MSDTVGVVLGSGGARGAYEAGAIAGLVDVLGLGPEDAAPFQVFAGSSVGAINAAFLAANAERGDMGVASLVRQWTSLRLRAHLELDLWGALGLRWLPKTRRFEPDADGAGALYGRSVLDPRPLHHVVEGSIPFDRLHVNTARGLVRALIVTALHIGTGRTHMFVELGKGARYVPSRDPKRVGVLEPISADHVLASAAIPLLFPARRVGGAYYCDGGLRFNTPLSPAIRAGARRLFVVSMIRREEFLVSDPAQLRQYPNPFFLLGKLFAALLLDPVDYDLQVLERINQLVTVVHETLTDAQRQAVDDVMSRARGAPYERVETLAIRPSENIGLMAGRFLRSRSRREKAGWLTERVLRQAAMTKQTLEADFVSFMLFDQGFTADLVALGRRDVRARADEVRAFFGRG